MKYQVLTDDDVAGEIRDQIAFRERSHLRATLRLAELTAAAGPKPNAPDAEMISQVTKEIAMHEAGHAELLTKQSQASSIVDAAPTPTKDAAGAPAKK